MDWAAEFTSVEPITAVIVAIAAILLSIVVVVFRTVRQLPRLQKVVSETSLQQQPKEAAQLAPNSHAVR